VVSWADRVAYTAHDLEDAVHAGIVPLADLPDDVAAVCGRTRREQLGAFVSELVATTATTGVIGMSPEVADALAALRAFNYERIYTRPEALAQSDSVVRILRALVEFYLESPQSLPADFRPGAPGLPITLDVDPTVAAAVTYVGGMTDRYAFRTAVELLGWPQSQLPVGIDIPRRV